MSILLRAKLQEIAIDIPKNLDSLCPLIFNPTPSRSVRPRHRRPPPPLPPSLCTLTTAVLDTVVLFSLCLTCDLHRSLVDVVFAIASSTPPIA
ncbi:hypothetical protein U1Q18_039894 [Sarracenia purpurea var. burkii]